MKSIAGMAAFVAIALALTSTSIDAQGRSQGQGKGQDRTPAQRAPQDIDRDRMRDRDRVEIPSQDRDRTQDRTHAPNFAGLRDQDIYGSEVMSVQERNSYREQLQSAATSEERRKVEAQHRDTVQARATAQGFELASPGKGIYGGGTMTVEERSQYREELRMIESDDDKAKFMAKHREEMQIRAKMQGMDVEDLEETEEAE